MLILVLAGQHSSAKDCYFLTLIWWFLGVLQKTSPWKQCSPSFIAWVLKWIFWSKKCDSLSQSNYQLSDGSSCPVAGARDTLSLTQYFTSSTASWEYVLGHVAILITHTDLFCTSCMFFYSAPLLQAGSSWCSSQCEELRVSREMLFMFPLPWWGGGNLHSDFLHSKTPCDFIAPQLWFHCTTVVFSQGAAAMCQCSGTGSTWRGEHSCIACERQQDNTV